MIAEKTLIALNALWVKQSPQSPIIFDEIVISDAVYFKWHDNLDKPPLTIRVADLYYRTPHNHKNYVRVCIGCSTLIEKFDIGAKKILEPYLRKLKLDKI